MTLRQRARVALFKGVATSLELLPERLDRALGANVGGVLGKVASTSRSHLRRNVSAALSGTTRRPDPELLERFVDRGFEEYGTYWIEGAKLPAIPVKTVMRRFAISEGLEHLEAAKAAGRGVIIALPHIGSWEWGGSFLAQIGLPMTAVAEVLEPRELFEWFAQKRRAVGIDVEPLDDHAGTALLATLKAGGVVGLLCDRDIQGNGIEALLLGEIVTIPAGPATLALRTGATLLVAACYSGPGDAHHAVITPPVATERTGRLREDVARVTQAIADELSWLIRRTPEQWHVLQPRFDEAR